MLQFSPAVIEKIQSYPSWFDSVDRMSALKISNM